MIERERPMIRVRSAPPQVAALALTLLCAAGLLLAGCNRATILNPSVNDALRAENQSLRDRIAELQLEVDELKSRVAQHDRAASAATPGSGASATGGPGAVVPLDREADEAMPRVAGVQIDSASELVRESNGPDAPVTLRLWVKPRDGRGRFHQMVGRLTVGAVVIRAGQPPLTLDTASFSPLQIRDAWRSGFMGSHYAFAIPLAIPAEVRNDPVTISIRFDDALTGRSFEDQARVAPPRTLGATLPASQSWIP